MFLIMLLLITGCKTQEIIKEVQIPVETIKTEYIVNKDSVYVHDSVYTYIKEKNDTVYIEKYKEHIKYICETDTVIQNDTIPQIVEIKTTEYVEVEKKLHWYQKLFIFIGVLSIIGIIAYIGWKYYKNKYIWKQCL